MTEINVREWTELTHVDAVHQVVRTEGKPRSESANEQNSHMQMWCIRPVQKRGKNDKNKLKLREKRRHNDDDD